MNLKQKLSHFWNVTLGEDYPEASNIDSKLEIELNNSLKNTEKIEAKFYGNETSNNEAKGGKGNSREIVPKAEVNTKEAIDAVQTKNESVAKLQEEQNIEIEQ